jgi:hypothetical protein
MSIYTWQVREQVFTMGSPGSRSFPAVVIYNVDCDDLTGDDAGQTVIFEREEASTDDEPTDQWNSANSDGKSPSNGNRPD